MFTGIVEEVGAIKSMKRGANSVTLTIQGKAILDGLQRGDSVATNGVCLTVTSILNNTFTADVMHETLSRSSFRHLQLGGLVNLERAMLANGRFGGHMVSGHIDGVGTIRSIVKDDIAFWYKIHADRKILRYIIEKGSVTIDGISLTVATVERDAFSVSIIPHTQSHTTLHQKKIGSLVNIETDLVGKYIEKFTATSKTITQNDLSNYGF